MCPPLMTWESVGPPYCVRAAADGGGEKEWSLRRYGSAVTPLTSLAAQLHSSHSATAPLKRRHVTAWTAVAASPRPPLSFLPRREGTD